jgi:Fe-S cluster assembly iron-binding protein IscA
LKTEKAVVNLDTTAINAIRAFLADNGSQAPVRLELQSAGCCDPILGLRIDTVRDTDIIYKIEDLMFVISPKTEQNFGDFNLDYVDEIGRKGFVITSTVPVSEWAGFGVCDIKK